MCLKEWNNRASFFFALKNKHQTDQKANAKKQGRSVQPCTLDIFRIDFISEKQIY